MHIIGSSKCRLCGRIVERGQPAIAFPAFVVNDADGLAAFNDALMHHACFETHPLAPVALAAYEDYCKRSVPEARRCEVCGQLINDPDQFLGLGLLAADQTNPLFEYNYLHFHRRCIGVWPKRATLLHLLMQMKSLGKWCGRGAEWMLSQVSE